MADVTWAHHCPTWETGCECTTSAAYEAMADCPRSMEWQRGWKEGIRTVWRHARWFEPHEAVPVPGSERPYVSSTRMPGAECATCGEALVGWHRASPLLPHKQEEAPDA